VHNSSSVYLRRSCGNVFVHGTNHDGHDFHHTTLTFKLNSTVLSATFKDGGEEDMTEVTFEAGGIDGRANLAAALRDAVTFLDGDLPRDFSASDRKLTVEPTAQTV
jgi:hypothetical protein